MNAVLRFLRFIVDLVAALVVLVVGGSWLLGVAAENGRGWIETSSSALAATPEDAYWAERAQAMAQLKALADKKADPDKIGEIERAALAHLQRQLIAMVGPVNVRGYSDPPESHLTALSDSPEFGELDGVTFHRRDVSAPGELVVTTEALLRLWLQDASRAHPGWQRARFALKSDAFYGEALNAEDGYEGVAELELTPPPAGAAFAAAKLGRWGLHTDTIQGPVLIVTVVAGGRVFIATSGPATTIDDVPACRTLARRGDSIRAGAFGPYGGPQFEAWRDCVRHNLRSAPIYADLTREARRVADRLAKAK
jgi:hypothetical protein